mmetsp:Transcript_86405/g.180888  ORF Transcript_86405/g.180888 Transcript_86405/m.180888 type:complete len:107 (+) Transcript_86405:177-497(+)
MLTINKGRKSKRRRRKVSPMYSFSCKSRHASGANIWAFGHSPFLTGVVSQEVWRSPEGMKADQAANMSSSMGPRTAVSIRRYSDDDPASKTDRSSRNFGGSAASSA